MKQRIDMKTPTGERDQLIEDLRNVDKHIGDTELLNIMFKLVNKAADMLTSDSRVPLTENEILTLSRPLKGIYTNISHGDVLRFVSSIEAHHGINL